MSGLAVAIAATYVVQAAAVAAAVYVLWLEAGQ